jgi:hypothetical protein
MKPKTDKIALWFVRVICGAILLVFAGHYGYTKLFRNEPIDISGDEAGVLLISLSAWVAYEAIREFLKKKFSNNG